jgi:predicted nucleotidyltransferase
MAATDPSLAKLARQVVECYRDLPGIRVALITGSVARGIADESSDLDLYLYWDRVDRDLLRDSNRLKTLSSQRLFAVLTKTGIFEKHRLNGRLIDVESVGIAVIDDVTAQIDRGSAVSPAIEKIVAGLIDGVALIGQEELSSWQIRLRYTDDLARAQVEAHVSGLLRPTLLYKLTLRRGDALSFSARLSAVLLHAVGLTAPASRAFVAVTEPKWLPWQIGRMEMVPPHMAERIDTALLHPSPAAMRDLDELLREVLDLVDMSVPGADTRVGRFILSLG